MRDEAVRTVDGRGVIKCTECKQRTSVTGLIRVFEYRGKKVESFNPRSCAVCGSTNQEVV